MLNNQTFLQHWVVVEDTFLHKQRKIAKKCLYFLQNTKKQCFFVLKQSKKDKITTFYTKTRSNIRKKLHKLHFSKR